MKSQHELISRINQIEVEIDFLERLKKEQMSKKCRHRDYGLLDFISKEVEKYSFLIDELRWVIK